ncbi:hypothetical protein HNP84_008423 [Thermocatellispora tengchongensis]|uniref:Uncharacterized protein n=1 Tax=Thermocatellispora tengchongensis TaxID=1073253 RepID=A0A840PI62_9ACTN|nr:hypothetical protein [Thermocatellispora tengchongensis]MBB5138669.1 hypothetical protein [Thermocatellispora tengchongensis]
MNNELTRREEMSLAGAALRGAPWKAAAISGGVATGASLVMGLLPPNPPDVTWALSLGITLFTLVAAIGSVAKPHVADRVTRQARVWSLRHPFRFSLWPAAGAAVLMYPVQLVFDGEGPFGAAWDAAWGGALVYLIAGVLTLTLKGRADER